VGVVVDEVAYTGINDGGGGGVGNAFAQAVVIIGPDGNLWNGGGGRGTGCASDAEYAPIPPCIDWDEKSKNFVTGKRLRQFGDDIENEKKLARERIDLCMREFHLRVFNTVNTWYASYSAQGEEEEEGGKEPKFSLMEYLNQWLHILREPLEQRIACLCKSPCADDELKLKKAVEFYNGLRTLLVNLRMYQDCPISPEFTGGNGAMNARACKLRGGEITAMDDVLLNCPDIVEVMNQAVIRFPSTDIRLAMNELEVEIRKSVEKAANAEYR
jgi:hypothetical protein